MHAPQKNASAQPVTTERRAETANGTPQVAAADRSPWRRHTETGEFMSSGLTLRVDHVGLGHKAAGAENLDTQLMFIRRVVPPTRNGRLRYAKGFSKFFLGAASPFNGFFGVHTA